MLFSELLDLYKFNQIFIAKQYNYLYKSIFTNYALIDYNNKHKSLVMIGIDLKVISSHRSKIIVILIDETKEIINSNIKFLYYNKINGVFFNNYIDNLIFIKQKFKNELPFFIYYSNSISNYSDILKHISSKLFNVIYYNKSCISHVNEILYLNDDNVINFLDNIIIYFDDNSIYLDILKIDNNNIKIIYKYTGINDNILDIINKVNVVVYSDYKYLDVLNTINNNIDYRYVADENFLSIFDEKKIVILVDKIDDDVIIIADYFKANIRYNIVNNEYSIVILFNLDIEIKKSIEQYYVYIFKDVKNSYKFNLNIIDLYIFFYNKDKQHFIDNYYKPDNVVVINDQNINDLYISVGDYTKESKYQILLEKFRNIEDVSTLEIYGNIIDKKYYSRLVRYIKKKNIKNVKLFDNINKFKDRLYECKYFCLFNTNVNEFNLNNMLLAISLDKFIICNPVYLKNTTIKNYKNISHDFDNRKKININSLNLINSNIFNGYCYYNYLFSSYKSNDNNIAILIDSYDKCTIKYANYLSHRIECNVIIINNKFEKKYNNYILVNTHQIFKTNNRTIYIFLDDSHTDISLTNIKNSAINIYIYSTKYLFLKYNDTVNVGANYYIIEPQLPPHLFCLFNYIKGLYISCGDYSDQTDHFRLIEEFCLLNNKNVLEIYGNIVDIKYYQSLVRYVKEKQLNNVIIYDNDHNFFTRLKDAEYFCIYTNLTSINFELLLAISFGKKIICNILDNYSSLINNYNNLYYSFQNIYDVDTVLYDKDYFSQQFRTILFGEKYENDKTLKPGLSFLMRVKNEDKYLKKNIESIYEFADEIIVVDNNSTDNTPNILDYFSRYYRKVSVYKYDNIVCDVNNNIINGENSISTYYNWCLDKVTKYNVIKWDGDFYAIKKNLERMIDMYDLHNRNDKFCIWFSGLTVFYNKYINLNSYYDEYRVFSKLHGFRWHDLKNCETSEYYVNSCDKRYVNGYSDTNNPVWLKDQAKIIDLKRLPIFLENKDYDDIKTNILDSRDENDNYMINLYKDLELKYINFNAKIILDCYHDLGGITTVMKNIYKWLDYIGFTVEYYDSKKTYNNCIFLTSYNREELLSNTSIKFIGFVHSHISYYNTFFVKNHPFFKTIFVVNNQTLEKYNKLGVSCVKLLRNNLQPSTITKKKTIDKKNVKILFYSRASDDKNIIMLIHAITLMDNVSLDIYSSLDAKQLDYLTNIKNNSRINVIGFNNDKETYLKYDICVLPSVSEGCSMNILESINYGIPILCTNITANQEIINNMLPTFDFEGMDMLDDELAVNEYSLLLKNLGYNSNTPEIFNKNVDKIVKTINLLVDNYDIYLENTLKLKTINKDKFYNIGQYINTILQEISI
jgi:hypothetical protein